MSDSTAAVLPRRPATSWPDALIAAVDALPGPPGAAYIIAALLAALAMHALEWATGVLPFGHFTFSVGVLAAWSIIALGAFDYLNRVAVVAARRFRPATDLSDPEFDALVYRLTHMPALAAWLCLPVAALWVFPMRLVDPTFFGLMTGHLPTDIIILVIGWFNAVLMVVGTYRGISLLLAVAASQDAIVRLDLFNPRPLFAFSALTVRVAIVIAGMAYLFFLAFPSVTRNPFAFGFVLVLGLPITLGSFVLPLYSTHSRMVQEKDRLEADIRRRIQIGLHKVHDYMDGAAGAETDRAAAGDIASHRDLVSTLLMEDEYIRKVPTWPWSPNTLRNLLVTYLLPMVVFMAQQLLTRLLGL
jgi:hypothetical protein